MKPKLCDSKALALLGLSKSEIQRSRQVDRPRAAPAVAGLALGPCQEWGFQVLLLHFYSCQASCNKTWVGGQNSCCRTRCPTANQMKAETETQVIFSSPFLLPSQQAKPRGTLAACPEARSPEQETMGRLWGLC